MTLKKRSAPAKIRKWAVENNHRFRSLNNLALFDAKGEELWSYFNAPCYAPVVRFRPSEPDEKCRQPAKLDGKLKYFWDYSNFIDDDKTKKLAKGYFEWLAKDSVWAPVFYTKKWNKAKETGTIFNTSFPTRFIIQAAILVRYLSEYPYIPTSWTILAPHMEPHRALVFASYVQCVNKTIKLRDPLQGHNAWMPDHIGVDEMERMVHHSPFNKRGKHMNDVIEQFSPLANVWTTEVMTNCYDENKPRKQLQIPTFKRVEEVNTLGQSYHFQSRPIKDVKKLVKEFEKLNGVGA